MRISVPSPPRIVSFPAPPVTESLPAPASNDFPSDDLKTTVALALESKASNLENSFVIAHKSPESGKIFGRSFELDKIFTEATLYE